MNYSKGTRMNYSKGNQNEFLCNKIANLEPDKYNNADK